MGTSVYVADPNAMRNDRLFVCLDVEERYQDEGSSSDVVWVVLALRFSLGWAYT